MAEAPAKKAKGTVFVTADVCKGCGYCIEFCPTKCLGFSRQFNAKGYHYPELTTPEDCSGCDLCGLYCPDFAIFGVRFKDLAVLKAKRDAAAAPGGGPQ